MNIKKIVASLLIVLSGLVPATMALAYTTTSQADYSPGSTVTISGNNSDGAGYLAGETVNISVTAPYGQVNGSTTVQSDGTFSWQFVLPNDLSAVGSYSYTVVGQTSGVLQTGVFADSVKPTATAVATNLTPSTFGQSVTFTATITNTSTGTNPTCGSVTFKDGVTAFATVALSSNVVTTSYSGLAVGSHTINADYTPASTGCNYAASTGSTAQVVNAIVATNPTLSVTNSPVTYNGSAQAATVVGSVPGTVSNIQYNSSSTVPTNAGTYAVTADFAPTDTVHYNNLTGASAGNFVILKADPTLSVTNSPVTYDGSAQAAVVSAGSVAGVASNVLTGGAATQTDAGTYAVTADFTPTDTTDYNSLTAAPAGNFVIDQATSTTVVTCPASVTYTGLAQTPCTTSVTGAGGLSLTPSPVYTNNTIVGTANASYTYAGDINHTGSSDSENFTINPAVLTVTASSGTILQGSTPPAITPIYSGFVNGETASVVTTAPTCSTTATSSSLPGSYPTSCSGGAATNYTLTYVNGAMHVVAFQGLFNPITTTLRDFQKNSTIPVKFALSDGTSGFFGGDATLTVLDHVTQLPIIIASSGGSNTGTTFRYDSTAGQYIYNLSTKNSAFLVGHTYDFKVTITSLGITQTFSQVAAIKVNK